MTGPEVKAHCRQFLEDFKVPKFVAFVTSLPKTQSGKIKRTAMSTTVTSSQLLPRVSVIMPVRQEGSFIAKSLGAVLAQDYPHEKLEVIVTDGMSTDSTREIVRSTQSGQVSLRLLDNPKGIVSTGMNIGIAVATGDVLIRVDGHCIIAPDYVRRCVEHLQHDGVEGVGGPVQTIGRTMTGRVIARAMSSKFGVGGSAFRTTTDKTALSDTVPFPAYWRSTVERAGPYDEELVRNQDDEYNYRLRKLGAKLLLAADVRSEYYSRSTYRSLGSQFFQYGFWKVRVMQKHPFQMSARQFVPIAFVLALHAFLVVWAVFGVAWPLLLILTLYILSAVAAAIMVAHRRNVALVLALVLSFGLIHFGYGFGFLTGLVRFAGRWKG